MGYCDQMLYAERKSITINEFRVKSRIYINHYEMEVVTINVKCSTRYFYRDFRTKANILRKK